MGVGKTLQALSIAWLFRMKDWPLLILAPSSLKLQWRDELLRWLPMRERDIFAFQSTREVDDFSLSLLRDGSIVIVSYDLATKLAEMNLLARFKFNTVIADEAHYLKNYDTKRTRLLTPILQRTKRVILVTGTPMLHRPAELFSLLKILRPELFFNFLEYS